jgi:hypothetical protein
VQTESVIQAPDLEELAKDYLAFGEEIKALEKRREGLKDMLRTEVISRKGNLNAGKFGISLREQTRETLSLAAKECLTEEAKKKYLKTSSFEVLTVRDLS